MPRAVLAGLVGAGLGALLVADHTIGWGVRGYLPALALIPSTMGGYWGGHRLGHLYVDLPRELRGVAATKADEARFFGPGFRILAGSALRLVGATAVLSGACVLAGQWTAGTLANSLLVAFGLLALATLLVGLLLSLGDSARTLLAVSVAVATEVVVQLSHSSTEPGLPLIAGASVAIALVLPHIVRVFSRPGRLLATAIWIP
jgi:hypothetical protein